MSHDIRTPMNAIVGFTALAITHVDHREQVEEYLKKIMTSGNHLLSLPDIHGIHVQFQLLCIDVSLQYIPQSMQNIRQTAWFLFQMYETRGIVLGFRSVDDEIRSEMEQKRLLEDALLQANTPIPPCRPHLPPAYACRLWLDR